MTALILLFLALAVASLPLVESLEHRPTPKRKNHQ